MKAKLSFNRTLINFGIPLGMLLVVLFITQSPVLAGNDTLSLAITLDLVLVIPLIYFLLIRTSTTPKTTVIPVMVLGLILGSFFLPVEQQTYLDLFKTWVFPVVELTVLAVIVFKVRQAIQLYREHQQEEADFYDQVRNVCHEILPAKAANVFATEVAVIYYALINWTKREKLPHEFSYHQKSSTESLFIGFILVLAAETVTLHYLLLEWNYWVAWTLTILSVYTAFQLLGFAKSIARRPITLDNELLTLRFGMVNEVKIEVADIAEVQLSTEELPKDHLTRKLSLFGELEDHNVIIHLKQEHDLVGLYGIKRKVKTIGLFVDDSNGLKEALEAKQATDS